MQGVPEKPFGGRHSTSPRSAQPRHQAQRVTPALGEPEILSCEVLSHLPACKGIKDGVQADHAAGRNGTPLTEPGSREAVGSSGTRSGD